MLPKFLQPERVPYASVEILRALTIVCAWCPEFNPADQPAGVSHGLCVACAERLALAEQLADDDERERERLWREEECGSTCSAACGYCGGCS